MVDDSVAGIDAMRRKNMLVSVNFVSVRLATVAAWECVLLVVHVLDVMLQSALQTQLLATQSAQI